MVARISRVRRKKCKKSSLVFHILLRRRLRSGKGFKGERLTSHSQIGELHRAAGKESKKRSKRNKGRTGSQTKRERTGNFVNEKCCPERDEEGGQDGRGSESPESRGG